MNPVKPFLAVVIASLCSVALSDEFDFTKIIGNSRDQMEKVLGVPIYDAPKGENYVWNVQVYQVKGLGRVYVDRGGPASNVGTIIIAFQGSKPASWQDALKQLNLFEEEVKPKEQGNALIIGSKTGAFYFWIPKNPNGKPVAEVSEVIGVEEYPSNPLNRNLLMINYNKKPKGS